MKKKKLKKKVWKLERKVARLRGELGGSIKEHKATKADLWVLIDAPDSDEAKYIREAYKMSRQFEMNLEAAMMMGEATEPKTTRGFWEHIESDQ